MVLKGRPKGDGKSMSKVLLPSSYESPLRSVKKTKSCSGLLYKPDKKLVEVAGIEPASKDMSITKSTCVVVFSLVLYIKQSKLYSTEPVRFS